MLEFRTLLEQVNIDPTDVILVRHTPTEKSLRRVLPWLVVDRPDLFLTWQRTQWQPLEKAMTQMNLMVAFIGQESGTATFAGMTRISGWEVLDFADYNNFPGHRELMERGMTGRSPDMGECLAFNLEPLDHFAEWIGRLVISWPKPYQQWWRKAARGQFPVLAIAEESRFERDLPNWHDLVIDWHQLQNLPRTWRSALSQWRGIYFIYDMELRSGYVGAAYGNDNILGRWRAYAQTGHGGNKGLRQSDPTKFRFSILELTSPAMEAGDVQELEASWKRRLQTREFGLNHN
jgi:hypothetical protein